MRVGAVNAALVVAFVSIVEAQDKRPMIAVKTFENPANQSQSTIGNALTDILITEIKSTGKFRVLERANVDELMKEMQFGNSDFAKSSTFAQKGQLLGAQYFLMGKVSNITFTERFEDKQVINLFGPNTVKRIYQQQADARVDFSLVDVATGESIISQAGESQMKNTSEISENPIWIGWQRTGRGTMEFTSTLFGKATVAAVKDIVRKLNALSTTINDVASESLLIKESERLTQAQGQVLGDEGGGLWILSVGSSSGLRKGDHLKLTRDNIVKDQSGKEIYRKSIEIGSMEITDVSQATASEARLIAANGGTAVGPKAGDIVRIDVDYARSLRGGSAPAAGASSPIVAMPTVGSSAGGGDARLETLIKRAESLQRDKFWSQALDVCKQASALSPGDARVLECEASAHYMMKDFVEGDESAEKLLQSGVSFSVPMAHYHSMSICSGNLTIQKGKLTFKGTKDGFEASASDLQGIQVHLLSKPKMIANEKAPDWGVLEILIRDGKHEEKFQLLPFGYGSHPNASGRNWATRYALEDNEAADAQKFEESLATLIKKFVK